MKVLVVGGGGREHALAWKVAQSPRVTKLSCAPGNPGIARLAECGPLAADDLAGLRDFARRQRIDLRVIGPEAPLAAGIVDEFRKDKLPIFGPHKAAARIEASKAFSKDLMVRLAFPRPTRKRSRRSAPPSTTLSSVPCRSWSRLMGWRRGREWSSPPPAPRPATRSVPCWSTKRSARLGRGW